MIQRKQIDKIRNEVVEYLTNHFNYDHIGEGKSPYFQDSFFIKTELFQQEIIFDLQINKQKTDIFIKFYSTKGYTKIEDILNGQFYKLFNEESNNNWTVRLNRLFPHDTMKYNENIVVNGSAQLKEELIEFLNVKLLPAMPRSPRYVSGWQWQGDCIASLMSCRQMQSGTVNQLLKNSIFAASTHL